MFSRFRRSTAGNEVERLASVLVDQPVRSTEDVRRRCQAADDLAALGPAARDSLPALLRTLVVPISVDCGLVLRVAAAAAIWKVSRRFDVALPFLAWGLKDEYWGAVPRAVATLSEIGHAAVVPDLVRLAERRLAHGPFLFEPLRDSTSERDSEPLLALVAEAIGQCARGRRQEATYHSEARVTLTALAASADHRVRTAATNALALLDDDR